MEYSLAASDSETYTNLFTLRALPCRASTITAVQALCADVKGHKTLFL
jgi:hypothetical protein